MSEAPLLTGHAVGMVPVIYVDDTTVDAYESPQLKEWINDGLITKEHLHLAMTSKKPALHLFAKRNLKRVVHVTRTSFIKIIKEMNPCLRS